MNAQSIISWKDNKGYITKDRATIALLSTERFSTRCLFEVIVSQAFTRPIPVRNEKGLYAIWGPGSRPWSLRQLAETAGMSVTTVRYGLRRLNKIGLIRYVATKLGTIVQALRFWQYKRKNPHFDPPFEAEPSTHRGDTHVASSKHYRSDSKLISSKLRSSVDVQSLETENLIQQERQNPQIQAIVRSLVRSISSK